MKEYIVWYSQNGTPDYAIVRAENRNIALDMLKGVLPGCSIGSVHRKI